MYSKPATYRQAIKRLLSPTEILLFQKLNTPQKIQDFLDSLPINFNQTLCSPREVLKNNRAQCMEGALLGAAILGYHGKVPLILDLRTILKDEDHVLTLYKEKGLWGALSKTNHAILRFRDPVYLSIRELALSYFHEYAMDDGRKTLREYSMPFDLRKYKAEDWVTPKGNLWWLAIALDNSPHKKILRKGIAPKKLRPVSRIERRVLKLIEWKPTKSKKTKKNTKTAWI